MAPNKETAYVRYTGCEGPFNCMFLGLLHYLLEAQLDDKPV